MLAELKAYSFLAYSVRIAYQNNIAEVLNDYY